MSDDVMWQCEYCLDYFDCTEEVEIWLKEQPFHRDCLKEKAEDEMSDPEPFIEEVERPEVTGLEFSSEGVLISKIGEAGEEVRPSK